MPSLKYQSFHSRHYEVIVDHLYGVHLIRHRLTDQATLLFTGSEGHGDYRRLKAAWRNSRALFDHLCTEYTYTADE